ncbi:MAG: hypothetical protein HQ582_03755 [Planctomycetes bacterium]|nr:hypothetical protein [Planctomycetota bacterium]
MPELPEVETMWRGIAGIVGSRIVRLVQGGRSTFFCRWCQRRTARS